MLIRTMPPPNCQLPIRALTADVMTQHRVRYLKAGVNELVPKPIDWESLPLALLKHCQQQPSTICSMNQTHVG